MQYVPDTLPVFLQEACAQVWSTMGHEAITHFYINCIGFQQCDGYDVVTLAVTDLNGVGFHLLRLDVENVANATK